MSGLVIFDKIETLCRLHPHVQCSFWCFWCRVTSHSYGSCHILQKKKKISICLICISVSSELTSARCVLLKSRDAHAKRWTNALRRRRTIPRVKECETLNGASPWGGHTLWHSSRNEEGAARRKWVWIPSCRSALIPLAQTRLAFCLQVLVHMLLFFCAIAKLFCSSPYLFFCPQNITTKRAWCKSYSIFLLFMIGISLFRTILLIKKKDTQKEKAMKQAKAAIGFNIWCKITPISLQAGRSEMEAPQFDSSISSTRRASVSHWNAFHTDCMSFPIVSWVAGSFQHSKKKKKERNCLSKYLLE